MKSLDLELNLKACLKVNIRCPGSKSMVAILQAISKALFSFFSESQRIAKR